MAKYVTRSNKNGLKFHDGLWEAFDVAKKDPSIWKISFSAEGGERVRLIRRGQDWVWDNRFDPRTLRMTRKYGQSLN